MRQQREARCCSGSASEHADLCLPLQSYTAREQPGNFWEEIQHPMQPTGHTSKLIKTGG